MKVIRSKKTDDMWARILNHSRPDAKTGCIVWTGSTGSFGHGRIGAGNGKLDGVHRVSYAYWIGKIPKGMCVCHTCDNPPCVNPDHLFLGTKRDNANDMIRKNRIALGEKNGRSKLSAAQVKEILASKGETHRSLAAKYGVNHTTIGDVFRRVNWAYGAKRTTRRNKQPQPKLGNGDKK